MKVEFKKLFEYINEIVDKLNVVKSNMDKYYNLFLDMINMFFFHLNT